MLNRSDLLDAKAWAEDVARSAWGAREEAGNDDAKAQDCAFYALRKAVVTAKILARTLGRTALVKQLNEILAALTNGEESCPSPA